MKKLKSRSTCNHIISTVFNVVYTIFFSYALAGSLQSANASTVAVHDPSIIIVYKDASGNSFPANDVAKTRTKYYYIFGTQLGGAYSTDMINWTAFTPSFSVNGSTTTNYYQLIKSEADYAGHSTSDDVKGNLWAPDIIYNKALGKWTMYFSLSGNAFKSSIIMFASSKIEGNYERVGTVVYGGFTNNSNSNARNDYAKVTGSSTIDGRYLDNAGAWDNTYSVSCIDPAVTYDESGKLWLSYGSWSGGIFLLKLSEQTGLRDYAYNYGFGTNPVWNGARLRYDPYMGIHIAGGYYVSGEGSYIRYIKDANGTGYYYLFISMGFYSPEGGYTMRVFRSSTINGQYTDVTGDNAVFDKYIFNYGSNTQYGMPIMQNYKYNWWSMADVAQGHNSVLTDEDGSAYLVYHTKFDNGTAWHNVEVHQLFFNKNGWPLAAPFEYRKNFALSKTEHNKEEIAGRYSVITHNSVDYAKLKYNGEAELYINADGTLTGAYTGTWTYNFSSGKQYLTLATNAGTFEATVCEQLMDGISTKTIAFTGMNSANERCLWGYKKTSTASINTTQYNNQSLLIGDKQYTLAYGDYSSFNKQTVSGDFEIEYTFDNYTQAAENWHNWAVALRTATETWYLRADAWSVGTFSGTTVNHSYTWDWAQFKDVYKNKNVKIKISRTGTSINVFAYADTKLVYTCTSKNSPTGQLDIYLGGESCYLDVKKISISKSGAREVVGTTNEDGTYTVPFNTVKGTTTTVSGNFELRYNFNNYHNPVSTDNWDNYILRVISGSNTMLIRADAYAMDAFGTLTYTYDWNWNTFLNTISGANIDLTISRSNSTITYKFLITARDGTRYNYQIVQTNAPTTDLSFGFTGEESMQDFFLVEKINIIDPKPQNYIYNYDNSGNYSWTNTNSWTPKAVPTSIDTVIIRNGEVQIGNLNHTAPVYVETNGVLRLIDTSIITNLHLQGGTLKAYTSAPGMMLTSNISIDKASTIMAGSVATTAFTLNGTISGNASLTKTSVGNLRINSTATGFKGNWIINEGKIQLRSATGLGVCGVQVKTGARLDIEVAGASIYSLVVDSGGGVDLDQNLNTNVAVFGTENILTGAYKNTNYPSYIGSTAALNVSNSLVALSGPAALCTGSSLTATASSGASYIWKNNTTQVGTAAAYTIAAAGSYTVDATNAAGCKVSSAPVVTTVVILPAATITPPSTSFCTGSSVLLSANTGIGLTYQWSNTAGTIPGATAATYTATVSGGYTVEVTNASGCKATSAVTQITVNAIPTATITTSSTSFCTGGSVILTSSTGSSYKWFNGTTQIGTAATYTATTAGAYTVEVTNASGCKATSAVTQITANTLPTASITAPATSFCTGGSVLLSASSGSSYKWFNGTTQVGTAATYSATAAGGYTVEVTNTAGCKATSAVTQITGSTQLTPTITSSSTSFCTGGSVLLTSSSGTSYKWFNGTAQVGTAATYTATAAGAYTVEMTNAAGCKATSAVTQITVSSGIVWYADTDKDGKGDPAVSQNACTQPSGYVSVAGDACPLDANKTTPGDCGCGKVETDTDSDGAADCIDNDDDNDGVADANDCQPLNAAVTSAANWYQDTDGDGKGDPAVSQTACTQPAGYVSVAGDACPLDVNKTTPGACGCGKVEKDTDGDGSADCIDNDDDNDGVADANDCQPLNAAVTTAANWYQDTDGDGKGDPSSSLFACTQPAGYVSTADDTCPSDPDKTTPGNCGCGKKEASCLDCAGTPNGTAVVDNCNICTGGTTGKTACVTTATVNGTTANITVTPQPFDNTTTIKLENNGNIQSITIISAAGALVDYKSGINNTEIIVGEELTAGLYTVIIQTDKTVLISKIVKK